MTDLTWFYEVFRNKLLKAYSWILLGRTSFWCWSISCRSGVHVDNSYSHPQLIMSNTSDLSLNSSVSGWRRPLWYQYEVCADAPHWFIFYFGVKVLNLVAGFPMNTLVLWKILKKKSEGSTSDVFIFNLSILDAYFGLMTPVDMANRLYFNDPSVWYSQRFAYGLKDVTPLFLTCICLDRYVAVVHPSSSPGSVTLASGSASRCWFGDSSWPTPWPNAS